VIPAGAQPALAKRLHDASGVAVLQHGWRHADHARSGKKSEYPPTRISSDVITELVDGQARLASLFGARALPIFVPPWNRFAPEFARLLPEAGLKALSVMAPTHWPGLPAEILSVDVHVDPIAWREHRGFAGTDAVLGPLVGEMRTRRMTHRWQPGAIGILTHHLIMDDLTADFIERLSAFIRGHAAARWIAPTETLLPV
jgi:peptidoglycan/xylan/chitin deacetylase (PgdA/CDA1 family)